MISAADFRHPDTDVVILGEALQVLPNIPDGTVDLIYIDPPFGTGKVRTLESIDVSGGDRTRVGFGGRTYSWTKRSRYAYRDDLQLDAYLDFLATHLAEAHRVLKPTGSLYLHLDFHQVHYARMLLDDIFGADRFLNEIIWAYDYGGRRKDIWPRKHDNILWYAKGEQWTFNADAVDRIPYMAPGLVTAEKAARGKMPTDVWWMTIVPTNSRERTGYPTQKPEKLLQRIIAASSSPNDLVLDFFAGSGTTGAVAKRMGRHYILVDSNPEAVEIAERRLDAFQGEQVELALGS